MATIHHLCEDCGSEFTIKYNEEVCESDPLHCPFCSSYILETDDFEDDED